jgi:hypothetical protein
VKEAIFQLVFWPLGKEASHGHDEDDFREKVRNFD